MRGLRRLPAMRAREESRHLDTFEVRVPTGTGTVYDKNQKRNVEQSTLLFTTKGRVKVGGGLAAKDAQVGERTAVTVTRELRIAIDKPAVPAGAYALCTAVDVTSDPTLLDARLVLDGPAPGSQTTCRRLQVSEVIS